MARLEDTDSSDIPRLLELSSSKIKRKKKKERKKASKKESKKEKKGTADVKFSTCHFAS